MILLLFLIPVLGLLEGGGILMLVPMLSLIGIQSSQSAEASSLVNSFFEFLPQMGISLNLPLVLLIFIFLFGLREFLLHYQLLLSAEIQQKLTYHLRNELFAKISGSQWPFFTRTRSSELLQVLTTDMNRIGAGTHFLLSATSTGILTFAYFTLAFLLSPMMTSLICGGALLLMLPLLKKIRAAKMTGKKETNYTNQIYTLAVEQLEGIKTTKSYGEEETNVQHFQESTQQIMENRLQFIKNQTEVKMLFSLATVIAFSLFFYIAWEVFSLPITELMIFIFLFARIIPKLISLQQSIQNLLNMLPAFAEAQKISQKADLEKEGLQKGSISTISFEKELSFQEVSFGYNDLLFNKLSFSLPAYQTTAIVGASGSGKSTLADLVMGLLLPQKGKVSIDSQELSTQQIYSWRKSISYVPQETFLFHDTIRKNLLWAKNQASEEELQLALKQAAADFVMKLPSGLDTIIGDRGVRLSGGERQRLALARALLRKPSLLVLDEATSALDSENEQKIQSAIEHLHGKMSILVITHRLSTIRNADQILVLKAGKIIEQGNWSQLNSQKDSQFRSMASRQHLS